MEYLKAVILALVEGITEFLPISSTGHLILVEDFLHLGDEKFAVAFLVMIQLPAILSVLLYFWRELWPMREGKIQREAVRLWALIVLAFLPAAIIGFLLDDLIEAWLFNPLTVALALIVGGVLLIILERITPQPRFETVHDIGWKTALGIGFAQCLAMIPGTSRSAATIIGAIFLGASRPAAAEFSFFLAIPTLSGAAVFKLLKNGVDFTPHQMGLLAVGSIVSFLTAYAVIAFLMEYVRKHSFAVFGWYRIVLGLVVLGVLWLNLA